MMIPLLIAAIENDEEREFMADLYERYRDVMVKKVNYMVQDHETALELVHDVFMKLIDNAQHTMTIDSDKIAGYIWRSCKNTAINYTKRNSTADKKLFYGEAADVSEWLSDDSELPEDVYAAKERRQQLRAIWPLLSEKERQLLEQKYWLDKSDEDIAKLMKINPSSVRTYVMRARKKAYKLMGGEY